MSESFPRAGEVHSHRASVRRAMNDLETAAGAPVAAGASDWREVVDRSIAVVHGAWERHIEMTESVDGLFVQIQTDAPEMSPKIDQLNREHDTIRSKIDALAALPIDDTDTVRTSVIELGARFARHRQHGSDLIYEAYSVDLGGGG